MEESSEIREWLSSQPGSLGECGVDTRTDICRCGNEGQCEMITPGRESFSEVSSPPVRMTSWSLHALHTSNTDTDSFNGGRLKHKKDCLSFYRRSHSLDDLSSSVFTDHDVFAFSDEKIHGTGTEVACHKLREALSLDASERTSIGRADLEQSTLNKDDVSVSIARQRSPSWVLLEHPDYNTDSQTSAFVDNYPPQLLTDTHKHLVDHLDVHSCHTDTLSLDHLSLCVGSTRGQESSVSDIVNEEDGQCPRYGDSGATCIDINRSCGESPTDDEPKLSSPQTDGVELIYKRDCSEGSMSSPADSEAACAVGICPPGVMSPGGTSSTESLYDSLTDYNAVISDKTSDTNLVPSPLATGVEHGTRADPTDVCSPACSLAGVPCMQPVSCTETVPLVSPVTICHDTLHWVSVKRRPTSLQVTPMYVNQVLPMTVVSSVHSDHVTEDTSSQTPGNDSTSLVLRDTEVSHSDDRSSTSSNSNLTCNTNRYSWPASQPVQLRSRSCSRLRRKHVKSANLTSAVDLSGSTSSIGLSRKFHSQLLPLTKSASLGHGMFQNARWGCPMTSARLNDSRKSEKFIMSLKKDGLLKPRTQPRCRHKRHSYHVTAGPCVTCTNHTNSLGPCFVLGVGQCNLCRDSGRSIDTKKNSDHPLVELEYVVPKSQAKTEKDKRKVVERADSTVRNEMQQYTREKREYFTVLSPDIICLM